MPQAVSKKSSEQRKAEYRDLLNQAENMQENEETGYQTTVAIDTILAHANSLFKDSNIKERVKHPDEVVLDAKVVATTSFLLAKVTDAIVCEVDTYDPTDFATKLRVKITSDEDPDHLDWTSVYKAADNAMNYPPKLWYLYGPVGNNIDETKLVKERKVRQKYNRQENAEKKEPEKLTSITKEESSVDDTVKFLQWTLNKVFEENGNKPVNYMTFAVNPLDFATTVENMFHLSFLIRDGRVNISNDEDGILVLIPISSSNVKKARKQGVIDKQTIISIDMNEWKEIIEVFQIRGCFLDNWKRKWESRDREN